MNKHTVEGMREWLTLADIKIGEGLAKAGGNKLYSLYEKQQTVQKLKRGIDEFVLPGNHSYGTTGVASKRASHGGTF